MRTLGLAVAISSPYLFMVDNDLFAFVVLMASLLLLLTRGQE